MSELRTLKEIKQAKNRLFIHKKVGNQRMALNEPLSKTHLNSRLLYWAGQTTRKLDFITC